jgi:hypothetical protein
VTTINAATDHRKRNRPVTNEILKETTDPNRNELQKEAARMDHYAGLALLGLLSQGKPAVDGDCAAGLARWAFDIGEAMLAERRKRHAQKRESGT